MSSVPPLSPDIQPVDTTTDGFFAVDVSADDTVYELYADFGDFDLGGVSKWRFHLVFWLPSSQKLRNSKLG